MSLYEFAKWYDITKIKPRNEFVQFYKFNHRYCKTHSSECVDCTTDVGTRPVLALCCRSSVTPEQRSGRRTEILSCARSALSDDRGLANRCSSMLPALLFRSRYGADARDGEFSTSYNLSLDGTLFFVSEVVSILCYLVKGC